MKKFIILSLFSTLIFCIWADPITKPEWFTKYKIINQTKYPLLITARFLNYKSPSGNNFGLFIPPNSNSDETYFFDAPRTELEPGAFMVVGPVMKGENYITPSDPIYFQDKDYTVTVANQKLIAK